MHIVLNTADLDNHTFTGLFYVDNGATYQKEFNGDFFSDEGMVAGGDYEYRFKSMQYRASRHL